MPSKNLVIRTSLSNKRVDLRENPSNPLIEASSLSGLTLRGSSPSQNRKKKNCKRRLVEANKQVNISHESGVLKASF